MNGEIHKAGGTPAATLALGGYGSSTLRTILHPTDYSESSRQAFHFVCHIAREHGSRLVVMHVAEPVRMSSFGMAPVPPLPTGYRGAWESRLRMVQSPDRDVCLEHRLEEGDVADAILRVARDTQADMIVMAGSERSWFSRLWTPSVIDKVAREANCLVIASNAPFPTTAVQATQDTVTRRSLCAFPNDR